MEEIYQDSGYRSAWRPLSKENELSTISAAPSAATPEKKIKNVEAPTEVNKAPDENATLKKLDEISADIDMLNHLVLDQSERISRLLSLFEEKEATGKKNIFGLPRK